MPGHKRAQPTAQEAEVRQLRAEIKRLEMENEILKKARVGSTGRCNAFPQDSCRGKEAKETVKLYWGRVSDASLPPLLER